jgi:YidC/Oxa1 family membrane protein insertase
MQKNSILFAVLSVVTIVCWLFFFAPKQQQNYQNQTNVDTNSQVAKIQDTNLSTPGANNQYAKEQVNIETREIKTDQFRAVFTNKGAAILSWSVKEKSGQWIDLVLPESVPVMATLPDCVYKIVSKSDKKIVFEYASKEGWKVTKTYDVSDTPDPDPDIYNMHNLSIVIENPKNTVVPQIDIGWGPGLGTDSKEAKENMRMTRVLACSADKSSKLKKLEDDSEPAHLYKWTAIDNRYFLAAFVPKQPEDFDKIIPTRLDKNHPYAITLTGTLPKDVTTKEYSVGFYLGPKDYARLKTLKTTNLDNLNLEKTVDFGFIGFLGEYAFKSLKFFHKLTHNYGWAIIMITLIIQILVLPLTLKSIKSTAAIKRVQPMIKDIQTKYKDNPQRLQAEMLNVYKSQKANPLGGCLPMFLQMPILYAFFTMLRNTYDLRNEKWILWIKDLSAPDQLMHFGSFNFNLLPLLLCIVMFLQQKMTGATSDPTQRKMMYIMPIVFTGMFWISPSGLVIYWMTNSVFSMVVQYFVTKRSSGSVSVRRS